MLGGVIFEVGIVFLIMVSVATTIIETAFEVEGDNPCDDAPPEPVSYHHAGFLVLARVQGQYCRRLAFSMPNLLVS